MRRSLSVGGLTVWLTCLACLASTAAETSPWKTVEVPGVWKKAPAGVKLTQGGYAWFRCVARLPGDWGQKPARLFLEAIDDAREVYLNGRKVASLGEMPPRFRSGIGQSGFIDLPQDLLQPGLNTLAIRMYERDGRSNFNVAAPALFAGDAALHLSGPWEWIAGDNRDWARPLAADKTDPSIVYAKVESADEVTRKLKQLAGEEGPLPPQEAAAKLSTLPGWQADLVLAEPAIGNPVSFKFDERGRMWVVDYLQYPNPAGLTAISRDKYLRTVWDKTPLPPPHHEKGADKITIHEDTNGDGKYDSHKTFVDGLNIVSSFARGRGGVWVLNPPYLLFYADADDNDVPDGPPEVHLEGFGIEDTHSLANSLRWGPDGWLYGAQGSTVTGHIKRYGTDDEPIHSMGQLVWRYHPERRQYEVFAEGGGNAFGLEIDAKGRIFSGHNGGDTRGFHYVQGGYSQKGFGKHGELSNPFTFGYFAPMKHPKVQRFTHTFVIYEGGAFEPEHEGQLFGVGPLQGHVVRSQMAVDGSTFGSQDIDHPLTTADPWFRPVDIQQGPDGALYVADFYEQRIDHASHYQGRVTPESGRIYRLTAGKVPPAKPFDDRQLSNDKLIDELRSPNRWRRQTALRMLGDRQDPQLVEPLQEHVRTETGQFALECLWALNLSGGFDEAFALQTLGHSDPYVRAWSIRLLCDDGEISAEAARQLAELAATEPHVEVRSQLACSARRLPVDQTLPLLAALLTRSEDARDPHLPLLLWWAAEAHAAKDGSALADFVASDAAFWKLPLVREALLPRLIRRFAMSGRRSDLLICARLLEAAPDDAGRQLLITSFEEAFAGRALAGIPTPLAIALAKAGGSLALRLRQGDAEAVQEALLLAADPKAPLKERLTYVNILGELKIEGASPVLLRIVSEENPEPLQTAALTALQRYDSPEIGEQVTKLAPGLSGDTFAAALSLLASRPVWSAQLVGAIEQKQIAVDRASPALAARMQLHDDKQLSARIQKLWPSLDQPDEAAQAAHRAEIERLTEILDEAAGNPYDGKPLFLQQCAKCHKLFDQGGEIGPDLTVYQRTDLKRILANVVNPSLEIREGFETYVIATEDGRRLSGFIAEQDNQVVVIRGVDGQSIVVPRDNIEEMRAIRQSIMPDGLTSKLTSQQIRDLFAYLRSTQPLP
ncbi:PVC-type heme-binding CxxCH protein [Lignipirellula cremea]|uniref:PVC-type heme-binding CxxCH protein n=1 Tax=Lignipirellula cremea TaxID=2528010 RepID=UPI0011A9C067|nr:PVC-type heme-binding CxxCH protein [Lignipirellula cremea]